MLRMHTVQAHEGDCLLLEHEHNQKKRFVLIDGGPRKTYDPYLKWALKKKVAKNGAELDLVVLSHVDGDHVTGLLDLFVELRSAKAENVAPLVKVKSLWHNTFGLLSDGTDIESRYASLMNVAMVMAQAGTAGLAATHRTNLSLAQMGLASIKEGERIGREARLLKIKTNGQFEGKPLVATGKAEDDTCTVAGLKIRVVGPTQDNLDDLKKKWKKWLKDQEAKLRSEEPNLKAMLDESVPNLSSIQMLVQSGKKRLLLTGDGRGDHLLDALKAGKLLDQSGGIDVDVLKVPHHGSNRNVDQSFFEAVRAKTYVISANGKHDNPDYDTLTWIVDAAKAQGRRITLALTNETKAVKDLVKYRRPEDYRYKLRLRRNGWSWLSVTV